MSTATAFLMFPGQAQAAIDLYVATLPGTRVLQLERHPSGGTGEGSVKLARVEICGQAFLFSDSPPVHAFSFTPSSSIFVDCDGADEQQRIFNALTDGGQVRMPLDNYGFSRRFGWTDDRFGVSWQINLPA